MKRPSSRTSRKAASSWGISGPYSALTSTSGIVCIRPHFSLRPPPVHQIHGEDDDTGHDRVLDEAEAMVDPVVARAGGVADPREREGPDGPADRDENGKRHERHLEDPGRDGDERTKERRH